MLKGASEGACIICRREFPVDLLVAAHIKQRSECTRKERSDYQGNVVAMCKFGCDDLFERGYISAVAGEWIGNSRKLRSATEAVRRYLDTLAGKPCPEFGRSSKYFDWHNRHHDFGISSR